MSRAKGFFTMSYDACHLPKLTPLEVMVLSRICSFGIFFESAETTAEFLNRQPSSIRNAKQKLERLNYICCIEDTGRGKKYIARADLRARDFSKKDQQVLDQIRARVEKNTGSFYIPDIFLDKEKAELVSEQTDKVVNNVSGQKEKEVTVKLKSASSYNPEKNDRNAWGRWQKDHPDLVNVYMKVIQYLNRQKIPVLNQSALRKDLTTTANLFRTDKDPTAHVSMISTYIDYLESPEYEYQIQHTQYCPRITNQDDLFRKFKAIRDFKSDPRRQYDPAKVLTK